MTTKRTAAAALLLLALAPAAALAQSSPGLQFGQVPTPAQWNSYFAAKQDVLGTTVLPCTNIPALTGDVTTVAGACATTLANIPTGVPMAGSLLATNIAAPTAPASGKTQIFVDSTDKRLHDINDAGDIGTTVVANTGAANNFLTAISAAGVVSRAQPSFANVSGTIASAQVSGSYTGITGVGTLTAGATGAGFTVALGTSTLTGSVPIANLAGGTGASATTFLRGDNTWATPAGAGDVVGPGSATDNAVVRFDSTTGKLIQNSAVTIDDTGGIAGGTWNGTAIAATVGGTGRTGYTQGDMLYSASANTLTSLAKSTSATRYLANTGTSNNPAWDLVNLSNGVTSSLALSSIASIASKTVLANVTGGSAAPTAVNAATLGASYVLLSTQTASASATLNFANLIDATYSTYVLVLSAITPTTDATSVMFQVGTGATPTWQTSSYAWGMRSQGPSTGADNGSTASGSSGAIFLNDPGFTIDNGGSLPGGINCQIFFSFVASSMAGVRFQCTWAVSDGTFRMSNGGGFWSNSSTISSVRITTTAATLASGTAALYGLRPS